MDMSMSRKRIKIRTGFGLVLGIGLLAGAALNAGAQASWEYDMAYDEDGNIIYDFEELSVTLPADWEDRYDLEETEDGVCFYMPELREYFQELEPEFESKGGELFSLHCGKGDTYPPSYVHIFGSGEEGVYFLTIPQGDITFNASEELADEWAELCLDIDWIEQHTSVTNEAEWNADTDQITTPEEGESTADCEYIVPDSSSRKLTKEDLSGLNADELQMAINEIYARHGRKFVTKSIQQYFDDKSWYEGTVEAAKFDETSLSLTEGQNIALMISCMNRVVQSGQENGSGGVGSTEGTIGGSVTGGAVMHATAGLNIRSKASTGSAVLGVIPAGYSVTVTGSSENGWVPVLFNGIRGYANLSYLQSGVGAQWQGSGSQTSAGDGAQVSGNTSGNVQTEGGSSNAAPQQTEVLEPSSGLQIYSGAYKEMGYLTNTLEGSRSYILYITSVGAESFDFEIQAYDMENGNLAEIPVSGTAHIASDGSEAMSDAQGYALYFSFPDNHQSYPVVTDIQVSGYPPLEGKTMMNNGIPGYEFN